MRPTQALLLAVGVSLGPACASTPHNYLDPGHPLYAGSFGVAPAPKPTLRIVTFNIEYALEVERAIEALRAHPRLREPDLLLLQEMDRDGTEAIARALQLNYAYCPSSVSAKTGRDIGPAVLAPWPIERSWKVRLPHLARGSKAARSVVGAEVAIAGRRVRVYSVHFGTLLGLSGSQRREQLQAVVDDARGSPEPVLIGGDFNSKGLAEQLARLGFTWPTRDIPGTWKGFAFDHVLVRGFSPEPTFAAGAARDVKGASDHYPAWVSLSWATGPA